MAYLSVIVSTAPGRENHLRRCLSQLEQQRFKDFEVVVVDDGSKNGESVVFDFNKKLKISYKWRPNDCCVSLSRNIGAQNSFSSKLVYIDADILLNH